MMSIRIAFIALPIQGFRLTVPLLLLSLTLICGLCSCHDAVPVDEIDPTSACAGLRTSYPSEHGLVLFSDMSATTKSIPWCFPGSSGFGVLGYNINIPISRPGVFSLVLSDIRPATQFALVGIDGSCSGDNTGKSYVRHGYGTQWSMSVSPGNYCFTLIKADHEEDDVWFKLTATRP
ncbi:MAG: hypothetical protein AB2L11_12275 [Syntrophobacteraceae bacterium]